MGENRRRLDADPFSTAEDLDESDDELLRSARVLHPSVRDRRRWEEDRGRFARVLGRPATILGGMEEVLGRAGEGRRREDEDRDRFEEVLPLWAEVLVRWFAGLRRFDRVLDESAQDHLPSAPVLDLSTKALLTSAKVLFPSAKDVLLPASDRRRVSACVSDADVALDLAVPRRRCPDAGASRAFAVALETAHGLLRPAEMSAAKVASLVVVLASLALGREANAEARKDRHQGFFPGHLTGRVTADPTQCGVATYCGGPVISNVQIVTVFWTDQVSQAIQQWAPGYAATIASSALVDMLSEYSTKGLAGTACGAETDAGIGYFGPPMPFSTGQTITRGSATQAYTIVPKTLTGSSFDDDDALVGAELAAQIQAGALPKPVYDAQGYPDTLYMVYFPASISITSFGDVSCSTWDGYHYSAPYAASGCRGQYLPYAVIPDCGDQGAELPEVVSHELAEAITDTDVGPTTPATGDYGDGAWYLGPSNPCTGNNCPQNCGEVGDVCVNAGDGTIPGTSILSQYIWSNQLNGCDVSNPGIGPQNGAAPVQACTDGTGGGGSDAGGSGVDAGSGSGGGGGGGSGSSGGRGTSGGSAGGGGDAGAPAVEAGGSDDGGGNADMSFAAGATGCACGVAGERASSDAALLGILVGVALIGRSRRDEVRR